MNRNIVGTWGSQLGNIDYAKALAALGVLESTGTHQHRASSDPNEICSALKEEIENGERTPIWRHARLHGAGLRETWTDTVHMDAAALAQGWDLLIREASHPRELPRLAVEMAKSPELYNLEELMDLLMNVDAQALMLVPPRPAERKGGIPPWHFPVRIGVPEEAKPLHDALVQIMSYVGWAPQVSALLPIGKGHDSCDALIVPPGMAGRFTSGRLARMRARFVICLDNRESWSGSWSEIYLRLIRQFGCDGAAVVGDLDMSRVEAWYMHFLRELSHDLPVHAALWTAGWRHIGLPPFILGDPELLDHLRIRSVGDQLDAQAESLGVEAPLGTIVRSRPFTSESVDAEPLAHAVRAKKEEIKENRPPRYLQTEAWRPDRSESPALALAPEKPNLLSVFIGPTAAERKDAGFPDDLIDFSKGDVSLDITLEIAGGRVSALPPQEIRHYAGPLDLQSVGKLPRFANPLGATNAESAEKDPGMYVGTATSNVKLPETGNSGLAVFVVQPLGGVAAIKGWITVSCMNRVLQSATLQAAVAADPGSGEGITLDVKRIHPGTSDCSERRPGDALLILSDLNGRLQLTLKDRKDSVNLADLTDSIDNIRAALNDAAARCDRSLPLQEQEEVRRAMIGLAANGRLICNKLEESIGGEIQNWERIQLITRETASFPIEVVYDGVPPDNMNAKLCPQWEQAMRSGACDPCPHAQSSVHICPLRFWGFSKVIERCTDHDAPDAGESPLPSRQPFGKIRSVLYGVAERAFGDQWSEQEKNAASDGLRAALAKVSQDPVRAADWNQWRAGVKPLNAAEPNLLLLIAHVQKWNYIDSLEIGRQQFLGKQQILPDVVGAPQDPKLVVLLGCSTADVMSTFASFPELWRKAGADIVCAMLAPVRGASALVMAGSIGEALSAQLTGGEPIAFGELLRNLRRDLFVNRCTEAFGLLGFGDGDWVFGG
ncbi:MAG: hypothetical protein JXA73_00545 [Acidobacteria bacterium]|nr:hypothetical protein [Acidobacteriota bacterium]